MKNTFWIGLILFVIITKANAQSTGVISGMVKDAKTGEPLFGATVRLEGSELGAISDINGFYTINNIPAKAYNVTASYIGYKNATKFNVVVRSGGNPDLNYLLEESVDVLQDVVTVARPFDKTEETPLSIQKLSLEEIVAYPGGNNDIAKVVQSFPGVSGSVLGFRNDVIIRGGAPNENVYYLDGIEIPNINHFSTQGSSGGPVGMLNVAFFEGVELASGSFGAKYDNVLSGVLQFNQRDGNNREFKTNMRLGASEAAITTEGPLFKRGEEIQSNTSFIASIRRSYLQLLFKALDLPFLPDYWDYQYKVTHNLDRYNSLIFTGIGSIDDFAINVPKRYDAQQQAILEQVPVLGQWTTTSGLIWKRRYRDYTGFMNTTISANILNNSFKRYEDNVDQTGLFFENESKEQEVRVKWETTNFFGNWTINGGLLGLNADYGNRTIDLTRFFDYENRLNFWRYGLFGQVSVSVKNRLSLSSGFRIDGNTFMTEGNQFWRTFSPRLSLSWQMDNTGNWFLNGSTGRYYKIPPYTILGFTDINGNQVNRQSKYIRSDQATVGIEHLLSQSARVTVEGFFKKYSDYPVSMTENVSLANKGGDFEVLGNEPVESIGAGRTYGVEFMLQQKFSGSFYGILAYTLYKSEFTGTDVRSYFPSAWDNRHLLSFTGGYRLPRNWEVGLRYRFSGKAPFAPVDTIATLANYPAIIKDYGRLGTVRYKSFSQADMRIDKKWNFTGITLEVYLEAQNIFAANLPSEPRYGLLRDESGIILQPRSLIEVERVNNSRILPSIGVVVNF
jgi:hypothetical protein